MDWTRDGADWPHRAYSRFIACGPITWHVQRLGTGPAILLIHGTGASTHSWRDVAALLADRFTVFMIDLPGHGFTRGRPVSGLALPGIAHALAELLVAEGIVPVAVAGHSAGAAIALQLVLAEGLTAPVVAFAPAVRPMGGSAAPFFSGMAKLVFANPVMPFLFAGAARHFVNVERFLERSTGSRIGAEGAALYERLFRSPAHCDGAIGLMAGWELGAIARALPTLPVKLIVAHGERDAAVPVSEARAVARISGGRLEVIPGLGHLAHEERPDWAARIIEEAV